MELGREKSKLKEITAGAFHRGSIVFHIEIHQMCASTPLGTEQLKP